MTYSEGSNRILGSADERESAIVATSSTIRDKAKKNRNPIIAEAAKDTSYILWTNIGV